jgi:hypothetical protein
VALGPPLISSGDFGHLGLRFVFTRNFQMPSKIDQSLKWTTVLGIQYVALDRYRNRTWGNTVNWSTYKNLPLYQKPVQVYSDPVKTFSCEHYGIRHSTKLNDPTYQVDASWGVGSHDQAISTVDLIAGYSSGLLTSEGRLRNEALISALNAAADAKVNFPVVIAEGRKTADMIVGMAGRVYNAYRDFRRGNFSGVARHLNLHPKTVHKNWLEYKYGWMPLLMDVKGAAEAFAAAHFSRPPIFTVSRTASDSKRSAWRNLNTYGLAGSGKCTDSGDSYSERKVRVKIVFEVSNPRLASANQLGMTNPALVAWELVPYSFVFDWFCHVGNWLSALTAMDGLVVKWAMTSTLDTSAGWRKYEDPTYTSSGITHGAFYNEYLVTSRSYVRGPLTVSLLDLYPPINRKTWSWDRIVTAGALFRAQSRN